MLGIRFLVLDEVALAQEPSRERAVRARLAEAFPAGPWRVEPDRRFYRIEREP